MTGIGPVTELRRSLACTNIIENMNGTIRRRRVSTLCVPIDKGSA